MRSRKPAATQRELNASFRYYAAMAPEGKDVPDLTKPVRAYTKRERSDDNPSEFRIQASVIKWWRTACLAFKVPEFLLLHPANGGRRDPIEGAHLKALGVRRGIPDLLLLVPRGPFHGCAIEMKDRDGRTSAEQDIVLQQLLVQGYDASVHHTAQSAMDRLEKYLRGCL